MNPIELQRTVAHQLQIWTGLYGPARAQLMADHMVQVLNEQPGLTAKEAAAVVDPEDDEDFEDFVATRW